MDAPNEKEALKAFELLSEYLITVLEIRASATRQRNVMAAIAKGVEDGTLKHGNYLVGKTLFCIAEYESGDPIVDILAEDVFALKETE